MISQLLYEAPGLLAGKLLCLWQTAEKVHVKKSMCQLNKSFQIS